MDCQGTSGRIAGGGLVSRDGGIAVAHVTTFRRVTIGGHFATNG
jgi:hypothetical protein